MSSATISIAPAEEPVTLDEVKSHCRIDSDDDDGLILAMITAAREWAENYLHRRLITQTWVLHLDDWPDGEYIELPFPPLQSVSGVVYTDYTETAATWSSASYEVDTHKTPGRIVLAYGETWPTASLHVTSPIAITYICGYGTPEDIPQSIRHGLLVDIADMYENRESWMPGSYQHLQTVERLYYPYWVPM